MNRPEMTPEEIELAIAGIKIFNKGSKMISIDTLDALYKWGEYWDYYREYLSAKSNYSDHFQPKNDIDNLSSLKKGDWVVNVLSKSKYLTRGKMYQLTHSRINDRGAWHGWIENDRGDTKKHGISNTSGLFQQVPETPTT